MSYCRWSSDNWMSDVYVYEGEEGWVIHVAGRRRKYRPIPSLPIRWARAFGGGWNPIRREVEYPSRLHALAAHAFMWVWLRSHRLSMWHLNHIPLVPIGLPHDSETFVEPDPLSCCNRLLELRAIGYNVPWFAIERLLAEHNERR